MEYFLQQAINGLTVGCIYGLVAMGYTLVHGIIGQINLAHGEIFTIGGFLGFIVLTLAAIFGVAAVPAGLLLALVLAALLTAVHGWALHRGIYRPLAAAPGFAPLVATIGLAIFLREYVWLVQDSGYLWSAPILGTSFVFFPGSVFPVHLGHRHLLIVAVTAAALVLHWLLVSRSRLGRAQRACAQDIRMAALCGVDTGRAVGVAFAIGGAFAAVAGVIVATHYGFINAYMGFTVGIKALTAAILGGIGSLPGAVIGGLLIGLLETFWSAYLSILFRDVVVFGVLVAVIVFRPSGILGRPVLESVPGAGAPRR
ncbi:MAG: branched-chain amino acid ABC transporter permease LivH [Alphaproteobacteria bacterium]|nr:branched-chain amino acid ABC transporter permease LivH [Alphaproteobacteria bacterium]